MADRHGHVHRGEPPRKHRSDLDSTTPSPLDTSGRGPRLQLDMCVIDTQRALYAMVPVRNGPRHDRRRADCHFRGHPFTSA